jgi:hypothetical protein
MITNHCGKAMTSTLIERRPLFVEITSSFTSSASAWLSVGASLSRSVTVVGHFGCGDSRAGVVARLPVTEKLSATSHSGHPYSLYCSTSSLSPALRRPPPPPQLAKPGLPG